MANEQASEGQANPSASEAELYRLLAENVLDYAIFLMDVDGRVLAWPAGAERLLGYREEEIVGHKADILFTPEDIANGAPEQEMRQALSTGRGVDDRWHVRKDGSRFWSSGMLTPLWNEAGALRGYAKLMRDRTEWKESAQARQELEASRTAVLETSLDAIVTIDQDDRIVEFNSAAERMFGHRREDVLGQSLTDLIIPPGMRLGHGQGLAQFLVTGEGSMLGKRLELSALRSDGTEFPIELAITALPTDGARLFTGYIRDITEQRSHEQRRAAQLAITEVLASAAEMEAAATSVLEAMCSHLGWQAGSFWLVDPPTARLRCLRTWQRTPIPELAAYEESCRQDRIAPGDGLPGRVWQSRSLMWLADGGDEADAHRLGAAAAAGLSGAWAMPILLGDQVLGVMEFLGKSDAEPDADLEQLMATVGGQIGQFLERMRAEQALRESEQRFRGLMEQSPFSVQIFSPAGETLQVNRAWQELWGLSLDQVANYNILDDPQLAAKGALEPIRKAFAGQPGIVPAILYDVNENETVSVPAGESRARRWVSAVAYPLKDPGGQIHEVVLIHLDITARKEAEDALRESEERFREIVSHSIAGVAEVDLNGRYLFANERYCAIVARSLDELRGLTMQEITHADDLQANLPLFYKIREDGTPYVIEKRYVRPDGTAVWVNNSVSGLKDAQGRVRSVVAVCVDITDRRRMEQAWREGEERLRALIDNLPHGAVYRAVHDEGQKSTRFTFLSAGVEQIFGISPADGVADSGRIYGAIHEEDRALVAQAEAVALEHSSQFDAEFRIRRRTGEIRWIHCRSAPHALRAGQTAWEGVILDTTDRKQAESALREHQDRLHLALDAGQMGAWDWDIRTNEVRWSPQLERIHGLREGSFPGTFEAYQSDIHPDDRQRVLSSIQSTLETGRGHHVEYRLILPDGSVRWVEARGKLFYDSAEQPTHMIGVCAEVTERKQAEQDLRFLAEASRSLAAVVDYESMLQRIAALAVPHFADWCVIYLPDEFGVLRQSTVAHVNPDKIQMAREVDDRWPPDPHRPGGVYDVFRTGKSMLVEEISEAMLRAAISDDEHYEVVRAVGMKSYIGVPLALRDDMLGVIAFIAAESGRRYTQGDLAMAEDLARRAAIACDNARLYATLRDEARKKDEFLAMLAHELRNPLAPIRTGLDLLAMEGHDAEILGAMQRQVEHLVRLVDDLLDVSRIMRGKVELRKQPVELSAIMDRAVQTTRPMIEQNRQRLTVGLPNQAVWLHADEVRLAQVIGNLLNNSSKYTEAGGQIDVTAELDGEDLVVQVRDNGVGIDPGLLPHVFDLFTQDQRTIDRSQGGLGIGLTVVKSLVELHGGKVTAQSEGRGQGTTFTVRLPTIASPHDRAGAPEAIDHGPAFRILVVDDNVSAARMLGMLLAKLGNHQIFTAYDGYAALDAAREHRPDLILLDIGLPKLDGFDVARRLRDDPTLKQTRIVALTGYGTDEDRRKSLEAGCDEHLVKPLGLELLQQLLARAKP